MVLSPTVCRRLLLQHEAMVLDSAAKNGDEVATAIARCQIDGMMNGILRVEGAEAAARFSFALSDRVAGGLPAPTDFRAGVGDVAAVQAEPPPEPSPSPARGRRRWPAYAWGVAHGVLLALYLRWLFGGAA